MQRCTLLDNLSSKAFAVSLDCPVGKWKILSVAATHQHIHIEDPAVFPCTDTEALQVHAVFVVEDFVESVTQLRPQLLASSALKLRGCIGRTGDERWEQDNKRVR